MTTPAPFLSRHLGDYLLVAQLSEDALGTVFRALYAADERRFVRLRILQAAELSRDAIETAVRENAVRGMMAHDAIAPRGLLDEVEGIPFLTWDETAGWTLDTMLARVRAFGIRIPAEYALLITERIAAALEHAHQTEIDGRPADHGLLWPGFVSISHDAAVRVGGFGVADGVLPSLSSPRLMADLGPYVAPEARGGGPIGPNSDVYSLGAILIELLTGRKPSLDTPSAELRAGDPRSEELEAFLKLCLAPASERFASAVDAHRALQQMVTGNPFSLYTANLALFLYKLLNPESQSVAPSSDWESTNPVVVHGVRVPPPSEAAPVTPPPGAPRRRRGDMPADEALISEPEAAAVLAPAAPAPVPPVPAVAPLEALVALEEAAAAELPPAPPWAAPAPDAPEPETADLGDLVDARRRSVPPLPAYARVWVRPFAALATAASVAVAAFFLASQVQTARTDATPSQVALAESTEASAPAPSLASVAVSAPLAPPAAIVPAVSAPASRPSAPHSVAKKIRPEQRQPAEDLRLKAALARIEADRLNASEAAKEIFTQGRSSEAEGERALRARDYDAAQLAFSRATRFFEQAQERTWEERVRRSDLAQNR